MLLVTSAIFGVSTSGRRSSEPALSGVNFEAGPDSSETDANQRPLGGNAGGDSLAGPSRNGRVGPRSLV